MAGLVSDRGWVVKAVALFVSPAVAVMAMLFAVVVVLAPLQPSPALSLTASGCLSSDTSSISGVKLDSEQVGVARTIISVGKQLKVSPRGWVIAIATGFQESGLRPLPYGDRDSVGVFQQRSGWGPVATRMDVASAARMFFLGGLHGERGLVSIPRWEQLPLTQAAQAVQVSAYADAYAKWEPLATQTVSRLSGQDGSCTSHGPWVLPTGHTPYVLTAGFGECGGLWAHCHTGQDFAVPTGTPIGAAGDGVVVFAGWSGPYGNLIRILHPGSIATWYGHLSQIRTRVGAQVTAGEVIGLSGETGNATGPHLHLEVRLGASPASEGVPIDPMPWLHAHQVL
ncbi:MAG: family metallopeptidase [Marmoricola sp.]|nr:family metallopeptidase [Marmoricola sp.]